MKEKALAQWTKNRPLSDLPLAGEQTEMRTTPHKLIQADHFGKKMKNPMRFLNCIPI